MKVFEAEPSRVFTLAEVAKAIGADSPNQLSSTMNRLKDQRRLRRAGWGKYELYVHEAPPQRGRSVA